ncbi:MAG: RnfH family protein [Castellaniella sp.]|uniref:RnfH family protein n=1 Tax=Castellaniella sp. TaxID=1955812 RepID=UPI002A370978|nr:RnfH family protein [Castellaniella sp.]MDY0308195.1 RnfH family protein [Castellaniella sp.]
MRVQIAFAAPTQLWRQTLDVPEGATVGQALALSGFAETFPEFSDIPLATGVYGERCDEYRTLREGDRVELYRPLVFDPLESRRRRAAHRREAPQRSVRTGAPRA